jgi:16S rRNA (uracil1498-N3)-methyltransferase
MMDVNTHEFALYTPLVGTIVKKGAHKDIHVLTDAELIHRIISILRLERGDKLIIFDREHHIHSTLLGIEPKKQVTLEIHSIESNTVLKPFITWVLPYLKREVYEEALYTLTELGAQVIQPLITLKTVKAWHAEKDTIRSQKIMIAAAEQSKQFVIPELKPVLTFDVWLAQLPANNSAKIFFDQRGMDLKIVIETLWEEKPEQIIAITGPEADLTPGEKNALREQGFGFCALTKTTLRAQQAITIGLGALRSLL